jgi:tetratricopeptide (TPR) repeat protein
LASAKISSDSKWLIKTQDRLLGPFVGTEVRAKILSKEFAVFDEVMPPMGRWRCLRDQPEFIDTIEEMRRGLMTQREDTEVQGHTKTIVIELDEQTKSISGLKIQDAEIISESRGFIAKEKTQKGGGRSYGVSQKSKSDSSGVREARTLWTIFAGLISIGILVYFLSGGSLGLNWEAKRNYSQLVAKAKQAAWLGDGLLALKFANDGELLRSENNFEADPQGALLLGALKLAYNGETVAAKRVAEEVLARRPTLDVAGAALNLMALAAIRTDDLKEAGRILNSIKSVSPEISFNRAAVDFMSKNFESAISTLRSLVRLKPEFHEARLLLAKSLIESGLRRGQNIQQSVGQDATTKREAYQILEMLKIERTVFEFDANIILAALEIETAEGSGKKQAAGFINEALAADPLIVDDQVTSPFLYRQVIQPKSLISTCRSNYIHMLTDNSRAVLALCMVRGGDANEAQRDVSALVAARPHEPIFQMIQSLIWFQLGRDDDARSNIKLFSDKEALPILGYNLMFRDCRRRSVAACEVRALSALEKLNPMPTIAMIGLSQQMQRNGKTEESREMLRQLEARAPGLRQTRELSVTK